MISVLSSLSLTFVVSHIFLYIIGAKPHRVSEFRRAIGSGKVVELVIVSI